MTREIPRRSAPAIVTGSILLLAMLAIPRECRSADTPPAAVCVQCHETQAASLAPTPHAVASEGDAASKARATCLDCHSGDRRHWEEEPQKFPMTNPAGLSAADESRLCSACHQNSHQQNQREKNVHARNAVSCSACHSVHVAKAEPLLAKPQPDLCFECHAPAQGQFARPFRHPVKEGIVQCSECHQTLDETRRELTHDGTNACGKCHAELEGPFVHEHPATLDFSTEEGGCLTCHEAHGSSLPRMLKQPYEAPRFQLCTQCHLVPQHQANAMHGTQWAGMACNDCHTDIHGSNTSRHLLSQALEGQGCFNVGCHSF